MKQFTYQIIYNRRINGILRSINKLVYPILPAKVMIPPSGLLKIKNAEGITLKIHTNQTNYLTKYIFWEGGYKNFEYTSIFMKLIKNINVFMDIGANIGYYSLLAAMENKKIQIIGFEPAEGPLYFFKKNVATNGFSNIQIEPIAISHQHGEIDFHEIKNSKYRYLKYNLEGESNAGSKTTGKNFVVNKVKTTTFDDFVKENKIKNIDLIKLDTEGTEHLILSAATYSLKEMKPIVICETLYSKIENKLEEIMKPLGYNFYNHTPHGLLKVESIIRKDDDGVRNCFFVHPSKLSLIEEYVIN